MSIVPLVFYLTNVRVRANQVIYHGMQRQTCNRLFIPSVTLRISSLVYHFWCPTFSLVLSLSQFTYSYLALFFFFFMLHLLCYITLFPFRWGKLSRFLNLHQASFLDPHLFSFMPVLLTLLFYFQCKLLLFSCELLAFSFYSL